MSAEIQWHADDRFATDADEVDQILAVLQGLLRAVQSPAVRACLEEARDDIAHLAGRDVSHDEGGDLAVA